MACRSACTEDRATGGAHRNAGVRGCDVVVTETRMGTAGGVAGLTARSWKEGGGPGVMELIGW